MLYIIPVFETPRVISIPDSKFSYGKGSHSLQLPLKKDSQVLFTMSDSTGFNAGGSSNVYTVLGSKGGVCNTTDPGTDFVFQLNSNLQQCRPFTFSGYDAAVPPVTIGAIVPGGSAFTVSPPLGQPSYDWTVTAARGTSMVFFMADSQGRQGGSSDLRSVGASDDSSCLSYSSPSTTTDAPGPTQTNSSPSSSSSTSSPPTPISAASIAGAIIGSVLFLAVVITLALFVMKRMQSNVRKKQLPSRVDLTDGDAGNRLYISPYGYSLQPSNHQIDFGGSKNPVSEAPFTESTTHFPLPPPFLPQPYHPYSPQSQHPCFDVPASPSVQNGNLEVYANPAPTFSQHSSGWDSSQTSTAQQKPDLVGIPSQPPSRLILHTDAEDTEDASPYDGGFIELPPQYSERRAPGGLNSSVEATVDTKHPL